MVCAVFFACENPWMAEILEPKTISFNSNGGSSVPSQKLYKGQKVKRPSNPAKSGAIFLNWYEDNGVFNKAWNFETIPTKDLTLYAKWDENTCTVTFINNGKVYTTKIVRMGSMVTPPDDNPHIPEGLYEDTNPTDDNFNDWTYDYSGPFDFENTHITSDIMLIARWKTAVYISEKDGNNIFEKAISFINGVYSPDGTLSYTLLMDSDVIISDSPVKYFENNTVNLTVKGINEVIITLNSNFKVTATSLTIGNNIKIACNEGSYLFIDSDASLTVLGNASIDNLTLNASNSGSDTIYSTVTINDGWTGSVGKLNLQGSESQMQTVMYQWVGKVVLKGLNETNVSEFTFGDFIAPQANGTDETEPITSRCFIVHTDGVGKAGAFYWIEK
jgi:uncharacterized repeat protein (TIGR02543 family)